MGAETLGVRGRDVVSVSRHAHAGHFAVDFRAACLGVFQFLQDEDAGTFAHHETVAAGAEGARCTCRVVVASGEGVHGGEAAHAAGPDGSFGTTGNDGVSLAQTNEVEGIGQGVGRGSASRGGGVVRSVEAVLYGDLSGGDVGNHLGDEEGVELRAVFFVHSIVAGFFLKGMDAADAYTENHADAVLVDFLQVPSAVLDGLHGSHECILLVEVHFACLFAVDEVVGLEAFHFAGELCFEFGGIKVGDRSCAAHAVLDVFPHFGHRVAHGGEGSQTRHYYSFEFHKNCKMLSGKIPFAHL